MRVTCPSCGAMHELEGLVSDKVAREVMRLLAPLPAEVGQPLIGYLGLFRPAKGGLTWRKTQQLLDELAPMILEETVAHRGRSLRAPISVWAEALHRLLDRRDRLSLPMTDNGYLLTAVVDLADKHDAAAERAREDKLREGRHRSSTDDRTQSMTDAVFEELSQVAADQKLGLIPQEVAGELLLGLQSRQITPDESHRRRLEARQEPAT